MGVESHFGRKSAIKGKQSSCSSLFRKNFLVFKSKVMPNPRAAKGKKWEISINMAKEIEKGLRGKAKNGRKLTQAKGHHRAVENPTRKGVTRGT